MKLFQWFAFMLAWAAAMAALYLYSDFESVLIAKPYLWIAVFIAAGCGAYVSIRLAKQSRK